MKTPAMIDIIYDSGEPTVNGRDLHGKLEVGARYTDWFTRMCEYGFEEGRDYQTVLSERAGGSSGKPQTDHLLTLDMAKELCMVQRSETGKQFRLYLIQVEKEWRKAYVAGNSNLPANYADALEQLAKEVRAREAAEAKVQAMAPKVSYLETILQNPDTIPVSVIAKDYGESARAFNALLHGQHIQYKRGDRWYLYAKWHDCDYTQSFTDMMVDDEGDVRLKTATHWTQAGRIFLYWQLKRVGILPLCERPHQTAMPGYESPVVG